MIIWFIGLSGSGKTYLSNLLYQKVKIAKNNTFLMDGDMFREAMSHDLGYNLEDRYKNGWRLARLSKMLDEQSINVIVPILSIFHEHQLYLQSQTNKYKQIYVKSNLKDVGEKDVKRVYQEKQNVVGRDIHFPEPVNSNYIFENTFCKEQAETFIDKVFNEIKFLLD